MNRAFSIHMHLAHSRNLILKTAFVAWMGILLCSSYGIASEKEPARISLLMASGMPGDTAYRMGLGLASLWTTRLRKERIRVSAVASEGFSENIEALRIADADIIVADQVFCSMAYHGTGLFSGRPVPEIRGIATLWNETLHLLMGYRKVGSGSLKDLVGRTLATGLPGTGNRLMTEAILKSLGPEQSKIRLRSMTAQAAVEALKKETVDAIALAGAVPLSLVDKLQREKGPRLAFLNVTDPEYTALQNGESGHFARIVIPPNAYPRQTEPVSTVGRKAIVAVSSGLDAQVVYELTKTLFENLDSLAEVHPAGRALRLDGALNGMNIPLHRGAFTYFKQKEMEIPPNLRPPQQSGVIPNPTLTGPRVPIEEHSLQRQRRLPDVSAGKVLFSDSRHRIPKGRQ